MLMNKNITFKMGSLVLFSLVVGITDSNAMIGRNIKFANETENPAVCEVKISNFGPEHVMGECSGTLISATQVYTAGHCFGRRFRLRDHTVTVSCGGTRMNNATDVKIPNPTNAALWINDEEPARKEDFAVLTLAPAIDRQGNPIPHATSPVAANGTLYFGPMGDLLPGVQCKALGYGTNDINRPEVDSDGNPNIGSLVEADLKDVNIKIWPTAGIIETTPSNGAYLATSCGGGDSGGPLFCQAPGRAYELVGTIVLRQHASDQEEGHYTANYMRPVWQPITP
jgi:hypothetical protein